MKGYRNLIPIALAVLMLISMYTLASDAAEKSSDLKSVVKSAELCVEQGLYDKAVSKYQEAISLDKSIDYYVRIVDIYRKAENVNELEEWANRIVTDFPADPTAYEVKASFYKDEGEYAEVFRTIKSFYGRGLTSEKIDDINAEIKYTHYGRQIRVDDFADASSEMMGVYDGEKWGLAAAAGNIVIEPKFEKIGYYANDRVAVLDENGTWYLMDGSGIYQANVSAQIDGDITDIGIVNEGVIPLCVNGKYGYYTPEYKEKLGGFDYAGAFNGGVAPVKVGGEWRIINSDGEPAVQASYSDIKVDERGLFNLGDRYFAADADGKYKMYDLSGSQVGTEEFEDAELFADSLCAVKLGGKWGFADKDGNIVIEPKYDSALSFSSGLAPVCKNGKWGYIDAEENEATEFEYESCMRFSSSGTALAKDSDGVWNAIRFYKFDV